MSNWQFKEMSGGSKFLEGTNWASVADCIFDTVGIQTDGSLWVSQKPQPREFYRVFFKTNESTPAKPAPLERLGEGHEWKTAVSHHGNALLLKRDGTLWTWQTAHLNRTHKWTGLRSFKLEQVGTDSDWTEISESADWVCLRKADGRIWSNCFNSQAEHTNDIKLADGVSLHRAPFLDQHGWRGMMWAQVGEQAIGGFLVGVRDDGTFRVIAKWRQTVTYDAGQFEETPVPQDIQLGQETNWLEAVAFGDDSVVTLKTDGSLWQWTFPDDPKTNPHSATLRRIGTHSDWLAVASQIAGFTSLAADGSLWFWRAEPRDYYSVREELGFVPLIGVSRKPQFISNIFAEAK